jgi:hypothetical protein
MRYLALFFLVMFGAIALIYSYARAQAPATTTPLIINGQVGCPQGYAYAAAQQTCQLIPAAPVVVEPPVYVPPAVIVPPYWHWHPR